MLPPEWRERVAGAIRGVERADLSWFSGGPGLSPAQQLAVYQEQFTLRMRATLRENLPGLCALSAEHAGALFDAYVADHPPVSWTLEHVGSEMERFLRARGAPEEQIQMAAVDLAIGRGFLAADPQPLRPEELAAAPPLRLSPPCTLLRLSRSVHRYRGQVLAGESPDPLVSGDFYVVLYRLDRRMRHLEMPAAGWHLLDRIDRGIEGAISSLIEDGFSVDELAQGIPGWFRLFAERALVEPAAG